jgi:hypothetical protein
MNLNTNEIISPVSKRKNVLITNFLKMKNFNSKSLKMIIYIIIFIVIITIGIIVFLTNNKKTSNAVVSNKNITLESAKAQKLINREFKFPLLDNKKAELTKITYKIENAELRKQIIVQGQSATAIEGKIFLILSIKITNDYDKSIDINARDYVRLVAGGNENEQLAADIHNDPVTVQPISTKSTRIGFPVNDNESKFKLIVGEIKGTKENIEIKF